MQIVWYGLLNYFTPHLKDILEKKADYISMLLKIGFPQIIFIKLYHDM